MQYRCLLDGVDISDACFAADDDEGWADCYQLKDGQPFVADDGEFAVERRRGRVQLVRSGGN